MRPALGLVAALVLALSAAGPAPAQVIPPQLPAPLPRLPGSQPPASRPQQQPPRPVPPRPDRPPVPRCDSTASPFVASGLAVFPCDFPDPMVLRVGGTYYAYGTATGWERGGKTFPVLRSTDLQRWEAVGDALVQEPGWTNGHLWAPSVLAARGGYYLYYSGRRRRDGVHCLAVATAAQPAGPFRHRRVIACGDRTARGYIDAAPLVYRRRAYLFFSVDGPRHSISVLPLSRDLLRADGRRRALIRVSRALAPQPRRRDGRSSLARTPRRSLLPVLLGRLLVLGLPARVGRGDPADRSLPRLRRQPDPAQQWRATGARQRLGGHPAGRVQRARLPCVDGCDRLRPRGHPDTPDNAAAMARPPAARDADSRRDSPALASDPFGAWRSLVAHSAGGRAVAGSNPVAPIRWTPHHERRSRPFGW